MIAKVEKELQHKLDKQQKEESHVAQKKVALQQLKKYHHEQIEQHLANSKEERKQENLAARECIVKEQERLDTNVMTRELERQELTKAYSKKLAEQMKNNVIARSTFQLNVQGSSPESSRPYVNIAVQCRAPSSFGVSMRRYLSEAGEREVLRVLREQLRHQQRVTSDDVRLAVRAVASQGGHVALPADFPPSRWLLEFKRMHGFVQFNSFAFGGGSKVTFALPERLEVPPLRSAVPSAAASGTGDQRDSSSQNRLRDTHISMSSSNSDDAEKNPSEDSRSSSLETVATFTSAAAAGGDRRTHSTLNSEAQRQVQLQHGFSQRHRHFLQQQQRRAVLVDGHRRNVAVWPPRESVVVDQEEMQSSASSGSENSTTTGPSNRPQGSSTVGRGGVRSIRPMPPHIRHSVSNKGSVTDDIQDTTSNASSFNKDNRGYKLIHTVPAETWEKAIAAVEHQGMSLRAAAKMFGVHFAALHRRVKKRAQGGQAKGSHGYFHPSDEAGIMRVVVARAELGVLITFAELMRLVEAAALRKLPNLSVEGARNLLTRFQSRNEQSIRHIIDD